jgi:hypothetical protein
VRQWRGLGAAHVLAPAHRLWSGSAGGGDRPVVDRDLTGEATIKPPDLNRLITLNTLLQTRSISRAALRLCLSQPTVSRALGQLRQLLADPLLVRSGSGMMLTRRGVELP